MLRLQVVGMLFLPLMLLCNNTVFSQAQEYPNRPIRIVNGPAGDSADMAARLIGQGLSNAWKQPVLSENRGGIGPAETVSKATPDGYTILIDGGGFWIGTLLQKMPYDAVRDFAPITLMSRQAYFLVVHPSLAATNVSELIALAKAKPGVLNYGSGSIGSSPQLAAELFKAMAGVNIVRVPYSSGGAATTALLAGDVQMSFANPVVTASHVKSGRLRALAVSSAQSSSIFPDIPPVATAVPGYEATTPFGIFAPAKTPETIVNKLNQEIVRILNRPETKEKFLSIGAEVVPSSPAEADAAGKAFMLKWGKLFKELGIKQE